MSTAFERRVATIAQQQFDRYRWLRENQEPLASQIKAYWTDLGLAFPNVAQYAPKMGDILENNRGHGTYTFQYAATHRSYPSHSAIVMEVGVDSKGNYLRTIGGNESDAVGMKEVRLDANGRVRNGAGLFIAALETAL